MVVEPVFEGCEGRCAAHESSPASSSAIEQYKNAEARTAEAGSSQTTQ